MARPAASPMPVSNSVPMTTGMPCSAARSAISATAAGPPTRAGLSTSTSTASAASSVRTAPTDQAASSAAIGMRTRRRSSASPSTSCAGNGCSTNSISKREIADSRSSAVERSHAPWTSRRRRMSGPMAARMARIRSTSTSVSRSAPAESFSVSKPDSTDCRAASAEAATPSEGRVALTPTPAPVGRTSAAGACSRSRSALSIAALSARPGAPCGSSSAIDGSPLSDAPSTASRMSDVRIVSATSPADGSTTASPRPIRPSSWWTRMTHDSCSSHMPLAVAMGRRNGMRTRSATSARIAVIPVIVACGPLVAATSVKRATMR